MNYCMARGEPTFTLTPELRHTSAVVVLGSIMSILDTTIVGAILIAFVPTLFLPSHAGTGAEPVPRVAGAILD